MFMEHGRLWDALVVKWKKSIWNARYAHKSNGFDGYGAPTHISTAIILHIHRQIADALIPILDRLRYPASCIPTKCRFPAVRVRRAGRRTERAEDQLPEHWRSNQSMPPTASAASIISAACV